MVATRTWRFSCLPVPPSLRQPYGAPRMPACSCLQPCVQAALPPTCSPIPRFQHTALVSAVTPALHPGPTTERFPRATSGLSYESPEMAHLFYSNEECLRAAPTPPCPGPEYRFYEVRKSSASITLHVAPSPTAEDGSIVS